MNNTQAGRNQREKLKQWAHILTHSDQPSQRRAAANGLYRAFHSMLILFFLRRLGNYNGHNTYEDLAIRTITKAFDNISRYDPLKGELSTWIFRIATNMLIDERRSFKGYDVISTEAINHQRDAYDDSALFELPSTDEDPAQMMEYFERQDIVLKAIKDLDDPNDSVMLLLRFYNNFSYLEICDHMQMPMGTVKARLNRAKTKLASVLNPSMMHH